MEDFGYQKEEKKIQSNSLVKKIFLLSASLFSLACFIYVSMNAYNFVYNDKNGNIEVIKSPQEPIKVVEAAPEAGMQVNHSIYEDIFGNSKQHRENAARHKILENPQPALPPSQPKKDIVDKNDNPEGTKNSAAISANNEGLSQKNIDPNKGIATQKSSETSAKDEKKSEVKKAKRVIRIQLAAMSSEKSAYEHWDKLNRLYSGLFSGLKPVVEKVDLGKKGVFYRLQIGDFYNQVEAEKFCSKYTAQSQKTRSDCIIVE